MDLSVDNAGAQSSAPVFDPSASLAAMRVRKVHRQARGSFHNARPTFTAGCFTALALMSFFAAFKPDYDSEGGLTLRLAQKLEDNPWALALWVSTAVLLLLFILFQIKLIVKYNLVLGKYLVLLAITVQAAFLISEAVRPTDGGTLWVFSVYLYVLTAYLLLVYLTRKLAPGLVKAGWLLPAVKGLRTELCEALAGGEPLRVSASFRYSPSKLLFWRKEECVTYEGEVDREGRPHGRGRWEDSDPKGETLDGMWEDGLPVGPFKARRTACKSSFMKITIGYFSCRAEATTLPQTTATIPKHCGAARSTVGVITAECCISGKFFRDYPMLTLEAEYPLFPDTLTQAASKDVEAAAALTSSFVGGFRKMADAVCSHASVVCALSDSMRDATKMLIVVANKRTGVEVPNFHRTTPLQPGQDAALTITAPMRQDIADGALPLFEPRLDVQGWEMVGAERACTDALIYIHGFNSSVDNGCRLVGQLWTFGSFPSFVRPYVFSWPTGTLLSFPLSVRVSQSTEVAASFRDMVLGIAATGVRRIHIMNHSMGIRCFCAALSSLQDIFTSVENESDAEKELTIELSDGLGSVTLPHKIDLSTVTLLNPEYGLHEFRECHLRALQAMCDVLTVYGDLNDIALSSSYWLNNLDAAACRAEKTWGPAGSRLLAGLLPESDKVLGKHFMDESLQDAPPPHCCPLDIIDCTHLDVNVQGSRHNGFTLNRSLVEDLFDVIVLRLRADLRFNRLERVSGNVFNFLVAPKFVDGLNE